MSTAGKVIVLSDGCEVVETGSYGKYSDNSSYYMQRYRGLGCGGFP